MKRMSKKDTQDFGLINILEGFFRLYTGQIPNARLLTSPHEAMAMLRRGHALTVGNAT